MRLAALPACACTASATVGPGSRSRRVSGLVDGPARVGGAPLSRRRPASHQPPPPPARRPARPTPTRPLPSTVVPAAATAGGATPPSPPPVPPASVAVILLAGGSGKRMGAPTPKQYLPLKGKPMAAHSLAAFAAMPEVRQIVIVCDPSYQGLFKEQVAALPAPVPPIAWASPGAERQDSVCNGLAAADPRAALVAVHDSARPVVSPADVRRCLADGAAVGAAVLGVPVKPTIKEVNDDGTVARTLERARLWEVQTPQVIRPDLLRAGFEAAAAGGWAVTDDVSLIEGLGLPVRVTPGSYTNIKVRAASERERERERARERGRGRGRSAPPARHAQMMSPNSKIS